MSMSSCAEGESTPLDWFTFSSRKRFMDPVRRVSKHLTKMEIKGTINLQILLGKPILKIFAAGRSMGPMTKG